jgi:hypothetical protein
MSLPLSSGNRGLHYRGGGYILIRGSSLSSENIPLPHVCCPLFKFRDNDTVFLLKKRNGRPAGLRNGPKLKCDAGPINRPSLFYC